MQPEERARHRNGDASPTRPATSALPPLRPRLLAFRAGGLLHARLRPAEIAPERARLAAAPPARG